jgi:hypothetical protein
LDGNWISIIYTFRKNFVVIIFNNFFF